MTTCVIVIPDADQTPEQLAGLVPGVPPESQVARRLAESGCRVFVPALIDRTVAPRNGRARLTNREFVYRSAFELGRHVIGYEVQKVLALVDWLEREAGARARLRVGDLRLRRRRGDRAVCRGARPADRGRLRQRVFRRPQRRLAPAGRSERLRPAGTVRRRRGRLADRAAGLDRRGGQGARVRHPAGDRRRAGAIDDARARDREGRGRAGPDARRRARAGPSARAGRERTRRCRPVRDRRGARAAPPGLDPDARLEPSRRDRAADRLDPKVIARLVKAGRAARRGSSTSSTATTSSSSSRAHTSARST